MSGQRSAFVAKQEGVTRRTPFAVPIAPDSDAAVRRRSRVSSVNRLRRHTAASHRCDARCVQLFLVRCEPGRLHDRHEPQRADSLQPHRHSPVARAATVETTRTEIAASVRMSRVAFPIRVGWPPQQYRFDELHDVVRFANALWILLASAGTFLLIACANVADLFLVAKPDDVSCGAVGRSAPERGNTAHALLLGRRPARA